MANHMRSWTKERMWRQRIAAWQKSGLTARAFCRQHSLSEPSFYAWRRVLAQRDREASTAAASKPVAASSKRRRFPTKPRGSQSTNRQARASVRRVRKAAFVPVEIYSERSLPQRPALEAPGAGNLGSGLEVVLPPGRVLRIARQFDATTLLRLLAVLEARGC